MKCIACMCQLCMYHIQEMSEVLAENLTQDVQVKLYRGTVLTILQRGGDELPLDVEESVS